MISALWLAEAVVWGWAAVTGNVAPWMDRPSAMVLAFICIAIGAIYHTRPRRPA